MVNWLAVLVAGIVMFAIGAVWYTALFGKQWRMLMGVPEGAAQEGFVQAMVVGFVANLVEAYVLAFFIVHYGATDLLTGAWIGAIAWLGFVATMIVPAIFYERRAPMLAVINGAYNLIGLVVMGAILGAWR
jgi:Protein of unknown function (DUF1761)